jgi:hypothetical protein
LRAVTRVHYGLTRARWRRTEAITGGPRRAATLTGYAAGWGIRSCCSSWARLFSSYLIPLATRSWQNHEKELEVKTALVGDMSATLTDILTAIESVESLADQVPGPNRQLDESKRRLNDAYHKSVTDSAVLASELRAYFPDDDLAVQWSRLSRQLLLLYRHTNTTGSLEEGRIDDLRHIFRGVNAIDPDSSDLDRVRAEERKWLEQLPGLSAHVRLWAETKAEILRRNDALTERVLDSNVDAF